jgi:hypothetical protein
VRSLPCLPKRTNNLRNLVLACYLVTSACTSHIEAPRRAAADLAGCAAVGMSYLDFVHKLQSFSSAIELARREGASASELRPFTQAFEFYRESQTLWKMKIDCASAFAPGQELLCPLWGSRVLGETTLDDIGELAKKYGVPYDRTAEAKWRTAQREAKDENSLRAAVFPAYAIQKANAEVFAPLLSAIWKKAAQETER